MGRASLVNFGEGLAARVASGTGDKVLWVHGYTLDSSSWIELWNLLPEWTHIGVDLPGHGASLPLQPDENLPALAKRIGRLALRENVRHLVALSFGTVVALQVAIEFPTSFQSVILGAPALGGGPQESEVATRYQELVEMYRTRGFGPELRRRWMQSPPNIFKGAENRGELWDQLWKIVGRHPWWELADGSYAALSSHPQTKSQLSQIAAATMVLVGDHEFPTFKRCAEIIRRSVPRCERIYLPGVGHLCMLEDPARVHMIMEHHWHSLS